MDNKTKEILEQTLANLYKRQAISFPQNVQSYLIAPNEQFLGTITSDRYDNNSVLNQYGPYGSKYSPTSIFNPYSPYGSYYGAYSIDNPYTTMPPKLFIGGNFKGHITANNHVPNQIHPETFFYTLENNINKLLIGQFINPPTSHHILNNESYIESADGTYLGSLVPSMFNQYSIFNKLGPYGNMFSQTSIFNKFNPYGNQFSNLSPYNPFSTTPPRVYINGRFVGYLTVNKNITNRIHPDDIFNWAKKNISIFGN